MKKALCIFEGILIAIILICVFVIGGQIGAYAWFAAVFILAPIAIVVSVIELIMLIIYFAKHKKKALLFVRLILSIIIALPFSVLIGISPVTYPTKANENDAVKAVMPIENAVVFGGKEYKSHAYWPSECYAYDLLKDPYDIGTENLCDYGIYGSEVKCPVSGTVTALENNEPDIIPNCEEFSSKLGNYVAIRIDDSGTYMILAHLKQNSVCVKENDHVTQNQVIGLVGNSGTTSEPHLHIQHQRNNPDDISVAVCAEGLPIQFI